MRRITTIFFCMSLFLLINLFVADAATKKTTQKVTNSIEITTKSAPVYDNNQVVGYLRLGEIFTYQQETPSSYLIQLENATVYLNKSHAKKVNQNVFEGTTVNKTSQAIVTTKLTSFTNKNGRVIYQASPDRRLPVLSSNKKQYMVAIGNRKAYVNKSDVKVDKGIPVLMYHHILRDRENKNYRNVSTTISDVQFEQQMNFLKKSGHTTITPLDLEQYLKGAKNLSAKSVLITFDDGLKSNVIYAYPVLKKNGQQATIFTITSRMQDNPKAFDPNGLQFISKQEVAQTKGTFNYEGHTHELHATGEKNKSLVVLASKTELKKDLHKSKQVLPQSYFAYPFGQYNSTTIKALKESDYRLAFTTKTGYVTRTSDTYQLPRIGITPKTTQKQFEQYFK